MIYTAWYDSPVGRLLLAEKEEALAGLWIEGQKYFLGALREESMERAESVVLKQTKEWLNRYFEGEKPNSKELPLAPVGSAFRRMVWDILCEIPYGETTTYGTIAKRIAELRGTATLSAQAVGGAVGHNPVSIIIPCHRVLGAKGSLTGYAGGIEVKRRLLLHEGVEIKVNMEIKGD